MKIYSFIVPLTLSCSILSGCTSLTPPPKPAATTTEPAPTATDAPNGEQTAALPPAEKLPNLELTEEIFFKVVSSEIAFQRGYFPDAFATLISAAQQTHDPRLSRRALQMAIIAKQPVQAFYASRLWYETEPDSEEALQYYLGFLILNNSWDEVKSLLSSHLKDATPKERGFLILQSERLVMRGANKEASFNLLEELYRPYPDYLETHLAMAQAAFASNNSIRALVEAHAGLKISPDSQIAVLTLAQVSPSPEEALKVMASFLAQYPASAEVRRAYAGMLIEQKQYAQARTQYDLILAEKPDDAGVLYTLGVLSLQLNDMPAAEKNLKAYVVVMEDSEEQRDPKLTTAYLYLSQIADDKKDGATAMAWLAKIESFDGKNAAFFNAQLRRAVLLSKYENLDQARDFLHQLKGSPEELIQIIQLDAELLRNANREKDAMEVLEDAIKLHPKNPDLLYDYAMLAEKFDRVEEMETALRKVIEINPDNQQAYNALGYSFADRNIRLTEARTLLEKALSLAPDDAFIIDSMGWLEYREHKNEAALAHLQRAYQLRPDVDIAVHVGEVLWVMGDQQKARAILKEAQTKEPDNAALKSTLERLKITL